MIKRSLRKTHHKNRPKRLQLTIDLIVVSVTVIAAHLIYSNFKLEPTGTTLFKQIILILCAGIFSFILAARYASSHKWVGFSRISYKLIAVISLAAFLMVFTICSDLFHYRNAFQVPVPVICIHLLLNAVVLVGIELLNDELHTSEELAIDISKNVLIFGTGLLGRTTYNMLSNDLRSRCNSVGFIDDNTKALDEQVNTLPVYTLNSLTPGFIKKENIKEVVIARHNIAPSRLLNIFKCLRTLELKVTIVSAEEEWLDGVLGIDQIKTLSIEALLKGNSTSNTNPKLKDEYDNKIIFITGAAGSIGSEIARKLTHYTYKKLILIDTAESGLYDLQQELLRSHITNYEVIVADIRDTIRMEALICKYHPEIIFHAAAYKHVPLMEDNPYEAIHVNVGGTINMVELAITYNIYKFILISTDKAVNPTSVMGATKRIAELYVNAQQERSKTIFMTTRFGNVLGSNGSITPLFKKQIDAGGPLTLTHKDTTRYFITLPEACQLVLEATLMGDGGEIFVFDMGEPVKIFDLAQLMILLSYKRFPEDIDIVVTGLRAGEKMHEELFRDGDITTLTTHKNIMIIQSTVIQASNLSKNITQLCRMNALNEDHKTMALVKKILPEYSSYNSKSKVLDE